MGTLVRALLILAKQYRRIGKEMQTIRELYELDLESRGIRRIDPGIKDDVEIAYPGDKTQEQFLPWG